MERELAIVTGNRGIGFHVASGLCARGSDVIMGSRDVELGGRAAAAINARGYPGRIFHERLDLADLKSVRRFAELITPEADRLTKVVNNAGAMFSGCEVLSPDGYEMHYATNFLGHFALVRALLPSLGGDTPCRIVSVTSGSISATSAGRQASGPARYSPLVAYSDAKLACLLFSMELHRRSQSMGLPVTSTCATPGLAPTGIVYGAFGSGRIGGMVRALNGLLGHAPAQAAESILFAASSEAQSGRLYGPRGVRGWRGRPTELKLPRLASDDDRARRVWETAEEQVLRSNTRETDDGLVHRHAARVA